MIRVTIYLVDGSMMEFDEDKTFISRLYQLKEAGYMGKSLINILISDDWGAPPSQVIIHGNIDNGLEINEVISYK